MKLVPLIILFSIVSYLNAVTLKVKDAKSLYKAVQNPAADIHIILKAGTYDLSATTVFDHSLGNALKPDSSITVTTGLHVTGKKLTLEGSDREATILKTNAGYGIFIQNCPSVVIKNLTITGGMRDADGNATSAAIVVKHANVEVSECIIKGNHGDFSKTIAGIIGIAGRDGAILNIHNNVIQDNSWDGIALYRGASAIIHDNLIFNGRGAGIGVTWDANAMVYRNVIHHYWKGIGSFGTSRVTACNNLVRDLQGWGITGSDDSIMNARYNEVRRIGNAGMVVWNVETSMIMSDNIIVQSGTESQWIAPLVGIWLVNYEGNWRIERNLFAVNREADIGVGYEVKPGQNPSFSYAVKWVNAKDSLDYFTNADSISKDANYLPKDKTTWPGDAAILNPDSSPSTIGIFGGWYGNWAWDPDKEPFLK